MDWINFLFFTDFTCYLFHVLNLHIHLGLFFELFFCSLYLSIHVSIIYSVNYFALCNILTSFKLAPSQYSSFVELPWIILVILLHWLWNQLFVSQINELLFLVKLHQTYRQVSCQVCDLQIFSPTLWLVFHSLMAFLNTFTF